MKMIENMVSLASGLSQPQMVIPAFKFVFNGSIAMVA